MNIGLLMGMVGAAVVSSVGEEISMALGKGDYAKWIKVAGTSLAITMGIGAVVTTINTVKSVFGA